MKHLLFTAVLLCAFNVARAEEIILERDSLKIVIDSLAKIQDNQRSEIAALVSKNRQAEFRISLLELANNDLIEKIDSLQKSYEKLLDNQKLDKSELTASIVKTDEKVQATDAVLSTRTLWGALGIVALIVALGAVVWAFLKKFKLGSTSIDEVRKAQEKIQEEAIQIDNKLIEILSNQTVAPPVTTADGEIDHSLTLKVADEIIKIEMNLARMDENIKGYKQLAKGVQRIKDNFRANDYEIVDMLGKQYQAGMKAVVTFVTDENLAPGQQIISRIIKPQVNYKQIMIQAAQIEVSQAE